MRRMINSPIAWSLRNRFLVACATLFIIALRHSRCLPHAGRCHPGPERKPGHRLRRLDRAQPAGGRGSDHLSALGESPGTRRREDGARQFDVRLLADHRSFSTTRSTTTSPAARPRAAELPRRHSCPRASRPSSAPTPPGSAGSINTTSTSIRRSAPKGGYDLGELRSVQDWFVRYQLNAVQGVAEVASIGGFVRQYQIEVGLAENARGRRVAAGR